MPTAEELMRAIDDRIGDINNLLQTAVDMKLKPEVIVDRQGPKAIPYLLVYLWKQVEPK
jgi:hypothetical protein